MTIIHVGRKVPKHLVELPGSIHLGKGIWAFKCALRSHGPNCLVPTSGSATCRCRKRRSEGQASKEGTT